MTAAERAVMLREIKADDTMRLQAATVMRDLVRHLRKDQVALSLLSRLLEGVAPELAPYVPPPAAPEPSRQRR